MKKQFGMLPTGGQANLYTISCGGITAAVTDFGANLVSLLVPGRDGTVADVVLGYDNPKSYLENGGCLGAVVGRNANRIHHARFPLNGETVQLAENDRGNNLHSGPDMYFKRMWQVESHTAEAIRLSLFSPDGDQGFPGNARVSVTYSLDETGALKIAYDGVCDRDTVFNMTNHTYFNLAGHQHPESAMDQVLLIDADFYTASDEKNITTGALTDVTGTPMDFRSPKPIRAGLDIPYEPLRMQGGYDHNFVIRANPCAVLSDPGSGRTLTITTDCPGVQLYGGNFLNCTGKEGVAYGKFGGVALETQFFPDAVNKPQWKQPFVKAGTPYHSETVYRFSI